MAELPEAETVRRDLEKEVVGKRVKSVEVTDMRAVHRHPNKSHFVAKLEGRKIAGLQRRGTHLLFRLDGDDVLVTDLASGGQLRRAAAKDPVPDDARVVVTFTQGGQLRFLDRAGAGELFVIPADTLEAEVPVLAELGFDPIDDVMSWAAFGARMQARKGKLKATLTDSRVVAGIGPVYSDEILFAAGLRYDRGADSLSTQEVRRLSRAVAEVLHDAIKHGGVTLPDSGHADVFGKPGDYQKELKVYGREGQPCPRCRSLVVRRKWSGRTAYLCEQCQV